MKRFLSLILTFALICTMLPTVFASEESAELELAYSYNFGATGYDSTSVIDEATLITYGDTSENPTHQISSHGQRQIQILGLSMVITIRILLNLLQKRLREAQKNPMLFTGRHGVIVLGMMG